jgi:hypothetical protein
VPAHFWQYQNTFADPKTLLTAKFTFGNCKSVLESSKILWKPQNIAGTVPDVLAPLYWYRKRSNPANVGIVLFQLPFESTREMLNIVREPILFPVQ